MKKAGDLDRLQGVWTITALELDGRTMSETMIGEATITIRGDRFTTAGMGATYGGTLELDETARPRHLDMHFETGPPKGLTHRSIYELKGDTLRLCISMRSAKRPPTFASPADSGFALQTLVRGGEAAKGRAPAKAPAAKAPASKKAAKGGAKAGTGAKAGGAPTEIEGEWRMVSGIVDSQPMDASLVQWVRRRNEGNVSTVVAGPQVMLKVEFTIDGTTSPKSIDYLHLVGSHKGKAQQGIFEVAGGQLTILVGPPGGARPGKFAPAPPKGGSLTVWKRA